MDDQVGKMCTRLEHKVVKDAILGVARNRPHCQRCANVARFGMPACRFATDCDKTYWHGCAQQSVQCCCDAPGKRDCGCMEVAKRIGTAAVEKNWVQKLQKS